MATNSAPKARPEARRAPFVSVVIPTYNSFESLSVVLSYLLKQTYPPDRYEAVIVDDGSTDGTRERLSKLGLPSSFTCIHQERKRQAAARNLGVRKAKGEIVLFLDSDIIPGLDLIEQHINMHRKFPRAAVQGEVLPAPGTSLIDALNMNDAFANRKFRDEEDIGYEAVTCNLSIRRKDFLALGGFHEGFDCYGCEDTELGIRLVHDLGLELRYSSKARGYSYKTIDFEHRAQKAWENGKSVIRLFHLHPELFHPKFSNHSTPRFVNIFRKGLGFKPWLFSEIHSVKSKLSQAEAQYRTAPTDLAKATLVRLYKELFDYAMWEGMFCYLNDLDKERSVLSATELSPERHLLGIPLKWLQYRERRPNDQGMRELAAALEKRGFLLQQQLVSGGKEIPAPGLSGESGSAIAVHHCPRPKFLQFHMGDYNIFYWDDALDQVDHDLLSRYGRTIDEVWVPSEFAKSRLQKMGFRFPIMVMPPALSWGDLYTLQRRTPFDILPAKFAFSTVIRARDIERLRPFLLAYAREFQQHERVAFLIFLSDDEQAARLRLQTLIGTDGSPPVFVFASPMNWTSVLDAASCYVYPGHGEDYHTPLLFASLMKIPVIAPRTGWHQDLVNGGAAYLFKSAAEVRSHLRRAFARPTRGTGRSPWKRSSKNDPETIANLIEKRLHEIFVREARIRVEIFSDRQGVRG